MPKLVVYQDGATTEVELASDPITCGRADTNRIVVTDTHASRDHCRFELDGGEWFVADLESGNGTTIDGRRITREKLQNGSVVRIGATRISYIEEPVPMALRVTAGPHEGRAFRMQKSVTTIGRGSANDIVLDDSSVSARHAELRTTASRALIIDLGSRNGIAVNEVAVEECELHGGEKITIGTSVFEVLCGAAAEEIAPTQPETGLYAALTPRVRIIAAIVGVILLASLLVKLIASSGSEPKVYSGNLLTQNPSFEEGSAGDIAGWPASVGTVRHSRTKVKDGKFALLLESAAGADNDISGLCWSSSIGISPAKAYEMSAFVKNSSGESAVLCVEWLRADTPWLRTRQFGARTDNALGWRRVAETFQPPSWCDTARFGCAIMGQGAAKFDGTLVRTAGSARSRPGAAAGALAAESDPLGRFTIFKKGAALVCSGQVVAFAAGHKAGQSLGTLKRGYPQVKTGHVDFAGTLGPDTNVTFREVISADAGGLLLRFDIDTSALPEAVRAVEWRSGRDLLAGSVRLDTTGGSHTTATKTFEGINGVTMLTFGEGAERTFVMLGALATVSATVENDDVVTWRLELPTGAGPATFSIRWNAASQDQFDRLTADMADATKAENNKTFGIALGLYTKVMNKYPLYAEEREQAAGRASAIQAWIEANIRTVKNLVNEARKSQSIRDFTEAERACERLRAQLEGDARADDLTKILAVLQLEHKAAVEAQQVREAKDFLANARRHIEQKEFNTARTECEYVMKKYPGTPSADEAKKLLDTIPPDSR